MASLMDDLVQVLEDEIVEYKKLLALAETLKEALIQADIPMVEQTTEAQQDVTDCVQSIDRKRQKIMNDMAVVLNKKPEELKVSMLEATLEKQPEQRAHLANVRLELKQTMEQLQKANKQNQVLLQQAMELLDFDMNLFRSMRQAPTTANYNRSAYNTGTLLGSGGFDAKQ